MPLELAQSRAALAQARRVSAELLSESNSIERFRDLAPYAFDRLDNVWRTIDSESRGRRTQEFGSWWKGEREHDHRRFVKLVRNQELKENLMLTRTVARYGGSFEVTQPGLQSYDLGAMEHIDTEWYFNVQGVAEQSANEVLTILLDDLESRVLPTAERLLQLS